MWRVHRAETPELLPDSSITCQSLQVFQAKSAVAWSHGDPVAVIPQAQFLHVLQQATDEVDVGEYPLKALDVCLCGS